MTGAQSRSGHAQVRHAVPGRRAVRLAAGLGERRLRPDPGPRHEAAEAQGSRAREAGAVGLGPKWRTLPSELSGGMQKRVASPAPSPPSPRSSSSTSRPRASIPIMADVINDLIVDCVKDGRHALSITHDMASARKIADRIAMLYEGQDHLAGPAKRHRPFGQRLRRPVHPRPRRRPDQDAGAAADRRTRGADGGRLPASSASQCGAVHPKWAGRCEPAAPGTPSSRKPTARRPAQGAGKAARAARSWSGSTGERAGPPPRQDRHRRVRPRRAAAAWCVGSARC
jgi:hypothetical protein